ncbi:hypothetical protein [Burkholderia metallica]|uniref:hypothetical protein n=1 Tax=Burkholderia metallica TaxID=488729 RepID=UPI0020C6A0FC|nr:hypothetical protein [Burkholderia metallica]
MATRNEKGPLTRNASGQRCAKRETGASTDTPSVVIDTAEENFSAHLGRTPAVPAAASNDVPRESDTITFSGDSLTLSGAQLLEALDFLAPDRDRDQLESELTFQRGEGHAGNGMYCWLTEYPEEGALFVDGSTAIPAEAASAPADERAAWIGPHRNGWEALNETRKAVAEVIGADPETWPDHGNAPLAIAAAIALRQSEPRGKVTDAARDVLAERARQINQENWTPEWDDQYRDHEMSCAAGCYAMYTLAYPAGDPPPAWPWAADWWKPTTHRRNLVKAGALILASIERLDRAGEHQ